MPGGSTSNGRYLVLFSERYAKIHQEMVEFHGSDPSPVARDRALDRLDWLFSTFPVVAILGARQVGKTTLARDFAARTGGPVLHLDLEREADRARLSDPELALAETEGLVVLDEIQLRPELFPAIRVLVDRPVSRARFLVLGSASGELLRQSSESLAGRIGFLRLRGFSQGEAGTHALARLWLRGGFPRSFLASSEAASFEWRRAFVSTFLERDLPQLGVRTPAETMRRFWTMLSHYHAQRWNGAELARAFGLSESSVRRYLDLLSDALVVRQLPAWHANVGKRQVRAPKVFVEDSGLLHVLLGIADAAALESHPKVGASWEGFEVQQIVEHLGAFPEECFHWSSHTGAEVDLLVISGGRRFGFEIKRTSAPRLSRSMRSALELLELDRLDLVHAGEATFPLAERVRAVAARDLLTALEPLRLP